MSYLSLYRKWRPGGFADVLAQGHVTETLTGALREDRVAHAYLFSGPRGTGKTSTARILAKALNCERGMSPTPCGECVRCREIADGSSLDVFEMDAASHTSVEDVREIRERIPFASAAGAFKVYIIDEAHQLSTPAFNALLKMLEEPPGHVVFVLCTTESHKLPATVVSRCQRFEFRRIPQRVVAEHLAQIARQEDIEADESALGLIARHARGSVRDGLSLLDQAAGTADGKVTRDVVLEILGEAPEDVLLELGEAIASGDILEVFQQVERLVEQGWDPRQLLRQLLEEFRALFLASRGADDVVDTDPEHRTRLAELAGRFEPARLELALQTLGEAQADMRLTTHPRLTLDIALARTASIDIPEERTMLARLERLERAVLGGEGARRPAPEPATAPPAEGPKAPEPVEEPASAEPTPAPADGEGEIPRRWDTFLEAVKARKRTTHALIREGWPIGVEGDEVLVGFARAFHAEEIRKPVHVQNIAAAFEEVFGRKLRIRSEVRERSPEDNNSGGAASAADNDTAGSSSGSEGAEESPVDLVRRGLGAEVVDELESGNS